MAMKIKNVRFEQDDLDRLERVAKFHNKDVSTLIREVANDFAEVEEWQLQQVEETVKAIESGEMGTITLEQFFREEK